MAKIPARPLYIGVVLLATLALGLTVAAQQKPDVPPIQNAERLLDLPGSAPYYWWLDDTTLLLAKTPDHPSFVRYSLTTHTEEPIPGLNAFFDSSQGNWDTIRPSPDGKWLLWSTRNRQATCLVSLTDPARNYTVASPEPVLPVWQYDGKGWVALTVRNGTLYRASFYTLTKPTTPDHSAPLTFPMPDDPKAANYPQSTMTPEGQFLVQAWNGPDSSFEEAKIFASGFGPNPVNMRRMSLKAPHANNGGEVFFSPQHSLVGWRLAIQPPIAQLTGASRDGYTGIWVTRVRTTKALGYLPTRQKDASFGPFNIRFTPDGKAISYVYRNALYRLPFSVEASP